MFEKITNERLNRLRRRIWERCRRLPFVVVGNMNRSTTDGLKKFQGDGIVEKLFVVIGRRRLERQLRNV